MGGFLGISQGWWADFLDSMSSRLHFSSQTEQLIGVEKNMIVPVKMRLRDVFETINQGFAPRFWCQGNKQRSTQETNAKVVVAQKINLAF